MLRIQLLGGFQVSDNDKPAIRLQSDRLQALLAYLVLHRDQPLARQQLAVTFWPDTADAPVVEPSPEPVRASFVGRQVEWAQLLATWRTASAGRPPLALVTSEAGIGKTHLAGYLLAHLERQSVTTLTARSYATERTTAYAPISQWLRTEAIRERLTALDQVWLTEVSRLAPWLHAENPDLPIPGPLTVAWQSQRLFEALARAILIRREPLLLFLDDMQWCDRETLDWLHFLQQFDPTAPLLIVAALRQEEADDNDALSTLRLLLQKNDCLTEISLARGRSSWQHCPIRRWSRKPKDYEALNDRQHAGEDVISHGSHSTYGRIA